MNALPVTCPHCKQANTLVLIIGESGHCTNPECPGYTVTLNMQDFLNLTPEMLASYADAQRKGESVWADELAAKTAQHEATLKAWAEKQARKNAAAQAVENIETRRAARGSDEALYG